MIKVYSCVLIGYEERSTFKTYFDPKKANTWLLEATKLIESLNDQVNYDVRSKFWKMQKEKMLQYGIDDHYYNTARVEEIEIE